MIRIGLTGVSGSGKSFVTRIFEKYGIPSVNSDEIVHELYSSINPCTEALVQLFGNGVLREDFTVDRKKLSAVVFTSREKLQLLNQTVHPFVIERIQEIAQEKESKGASAFLIEAPQLFEAGLDAFCDCIISVIANQETRIERLVVRDGITKEMAEKRISHQYGDTFFREKSNFCIENNGSDDLESQVRTVLIKMGLLV